ncbi:MAG: alpha/beta hydrolase [Candidatus Micrarchaeota archaeon]
MVKRAFLIHGWNGRPEGGWRPWLKSNLEKRGFEVCSIAMPNPSRPKSNAWIRAIAKAVGSPDSSTYLIGHSLGCIAILRYLESLPPKTRVGGAVLVAGLVQNIGMFLFDSFFSKPIDWKAINSHCKKFISINSDNDRYVPLEHGYGMKEKLGAELIIKKGMGHFSGDEGCVELPIALDAVLKLAK